MIPTTPPPTIDPRYIRGLYAISAEMMCPFLGYYIFCWLKNRRGYWFYPVSVSSFYLKGYAWRRGEWRPARLRMKMLDSIY